MLFLRTEPTSDKRCKSTHQRPSGRRRNKTKNYRPSHHLTSWIFGRHLANRLCAFMGNRQFLMLREKFFVLVEALSRSETGKQSLWFFGSTEHRGRIPFLSPS